MTTSGTTGTTTLDVADIIDHVSRRCGVSPGKLSQEDTILIKNNLFMFLTTLANRGINMWRVSRSLYGVYPGQAEYDLSVGDLDVLQALYRQPQRLEADTVTSSAGGTVANVDDGDTDTSLTQVSTGGNVYWDWGSSADTTRVNCIGLLPNTSTTFTLTFDVSDDAITWTNVYTPGATAYTNSVWKWYDLEPAKAGRYFRVRETGSATLNFREIYLTETWSETSMWRMNRDDYSMLPNKRSSGLPLQYWLDRQRANPVMVVWQVPSTTFAVMSLFTHKEIEDIGALSNEIDIPQRWYGAVVSSLALACLPELPNADLNRYPMLKEQAQADMLYAEGEERDASPTNLLMNIGPYTK